MRTEIIKLSVLSLLATTNMAMAEVSPYVGIAASWDHLSGKRSESMVDFNPSTNVFSNNKSLSNNKMNAYGFFGATYEFKNAPLFFGLEIQIGQGEVSDKLEVTVVAPNAVARHPAAEIARKFTSSFAMRIGRNLNERSQLYVLGGLDLARFRYKYTWEVIDTGTNAILGYQTKEYDKSKLAPLFGLGFERKLNQHVKVGAEFRMAYYKTIKIQHTFNQDAVTIETANASIKPKVSSLLLRVSYSF